jgi:hypothetical protein
MEFVFNINIDSQFATVFTADSKGFGDALANSYTAPHQLRMGSPNIYFLSRFRAATTALL